MHRRDFIRTTASVLIGTQLSPCHALAATDDLKKFRITRITEFQHVCPRPKLIGKNSHREVHGSEIRESVLRIATDQGIEGIGIGAAPAETAHKLIGRTLDEFWVPDAGAISPLERADHALFDLVGKALDLPAWKLFGGHGSEWVDVYDGGIYFNDLLPQYEHRGVGRLLEEVEDSLKAGHRAFKIKVGRGFKWMEKEAGFRRDIEVLKSIRRLTGPHVRLMVDANNGFDLETTIRFLDTLGDDLVFVEEMFPENIEQDLQLKQHLRQKGWRTRVADGESAREVRYFDPYLQSQSLDVLQPDIRRFGLTLQWSLSQKMRVAPGIRLAPHNWGSFLGLYMMLVLARGVPNFFMAEQDRSSSELFDTSAFIFREGKMRVPDASGCGLLLREDVFQRKFKDTARVIGD